MSEAPVSPADAIARIAALEASLARANAALAARDILIDTLRGQIARLQRMQFGASSEKLSREIEQLELALEELETERDAPVPVRSLPGHLPREEVVHEPEAGACTCPDCGGALRPLGIDTHEMLDIVPVRWRVVRNVRPKYSCRVCEKIVQAPAPVSPIARGKATFATLAHVVVSKFDPIVTRIRDEVLKADKIHTDDTPVPVLDPGRGKTATGRLWVYAADDQASGSTAPRAIWYRFTPDRTAAHPMSHLAGFRGFLQADAYAGYDGLYRSGVTEVACWAHFRRKVFDLHERLPTPLTTDILERIGALYAVEAEVRGQPPDVRCRTRQEKSRPLVDGLREMLDAPLRRLSPKSDMGKAIALRSKTISRNGHCAVSRSGAATGCSPVRAQAASAPRPSTPSSRPARPTASTRKPTSPMSSPGLLTTGPPAAGTNSCRGTGLPNLPDWRHERRDHRPPAYRPERHRTRHLAPGRRTGHCQPQDAP